MRILETAADVDEQVVEAINETLDWFDGERGLNTEEFIDRLCGDGSAFDIENYDNPATRKIMRLAREARRET